MSCENCGDKGVTVLNWTDAPPDFAVCLCSTGLDMRATANEGKATVPLWRVWCAVHQVDPSRVLMLEAVHTPDELAALGFVQSAPVDHQAALLAAGRKAKR